MHTTKQLREAAEELIEVLGLVDETTEEPIIIPKKITDEELEKIIEDAANEITPDDEISEETLVIIDVINAQKKKTKSQTKGKKTPITEIEEEVEIEEDIEEDIEEEDVIEEKEIVIDKKRLKKDVPAIITKEKKASEKSILEKKEKKEKIPRKRNSAFAIALDILGKTPKMTLIDLRKKVEAKEFDGNASKNGIRSAFILMKRAVEHLEKNNHYKD